MGVEIYPQSVFENQTNGTVFYREGKLNDPMMPNQAGIFESWRYSFDSGRQVFKATDTEKTYEKRLIKDKFGNPHWSEWMEIPPVEANGIRAIAINDRPLLLPNTDGAIKLQITPQMIDTYTKREIYELVNDKINEGLNTPYEYVMWIEGCDTALEVLHKTYPEGGEINKYYLVEPKPVEGEVTHATYFIWQATGATTAAGNGYQWIEVSVPDLRAFVSYKAFNEHTDDGILHIVQEEREKWNKNIEDLAALDERVVETNELIKSNDERVTRHINDVGDITSPHISAEERVKINELFQNVQELPNNTTRYVVESGTYKVAYEQSAQEKKTSSKLVKSHGSKAFRDGDLLVNEDDNLRTQFNTLTSENNIIEEFFVEFANVSLFSDYQWYIEADNGFVSEVFGKNKTSARIQINFNRIPDVITIKTTDKEAAVSVGSVKFYIKYRKRIGVEIGDQNRDLPLDLIGPENAVPTYNGVPLTDLVPDSASTAKWGKITGDIDAQKDLDKKIAKSIAKKISYADINSHLRWDVYRDGVIKSVIQQPDTEKSEIVQKIEGVNKSYKKGEAIITGIKEKMRALKEQGFVIYSSKMVIENISVYQDDDKEPLPVYFSTDNKAIEHSPTVVGGFTWDWPGDLFNEYDEIYLEGNDAEYITNAYIEVKCIKYGDVEIGLYDELNKKYYSIKMLAEELAAEVNNFIVRAKGNIKINAEGVTSIGGAYDYDAEKDGDTVRIYGQEADQRYAARANLEAEREARETADKAEEDARIASIEAEREATDRQFKQTVEDFDNKLAEVKQMIADAGDVSDDKLDSIKNLHEDISNRLADESKTRADNDDALARRIDDAVDANSNLAQIVKDISERYATKDEVDNYTQNIAESFDLVINSNEELCQVLADGTFEKCARILFKRGDYSYDLNNANYSHAINFNKVKYVKGEVGATWTFLNPAQALPLNYDNTKFDSIKVKIGHGAEVFEIDTDGERAKTVEAIGAMTINLLPDYSIYKVVVKGDTVITLAGGIDGKNYRLYIDQGEDVCKVSFTNFFENNTEEFLEGLENQVANMRTVIDLTCDNSASNDGFIENGVTYAVAYNTSSANNIPVIAKKVGCVLFESESSTAQSVNVEEDQNLAIVNPGQSFTLDVKILDGFAHSDSGYDYTVAFDNGTVIGQGVCDVPQTFKVPLNIKTHNDGTAPEIHVTFNLKPQLVTIELDSTYANYVKLASKTGFRPVQAKFGLTNISFEIADGFYMYGLRNERSGEVYQGSLPWQFNPIADPSRLDYTLKVSPLFYASFDEFDFNTVCNIGIKTDRVALVGQNIFDVDAKVADFVKTDTNYGSLYKQAPITLVESEEYEGRVDYTTPAGIDQEGTIFFDEKVLGKNVTLKFAVPGHEKLFEKVFFIGKIEGEAPIETDSSGSRLEDDVYILDQFVNENKEFTFEVKFTTAVNDYTGTWTIGKTSIASIVKTDENKVTIAARARGKTKLKFVSNFSGLSYERTIEVVCHAKKVDVADTVAPVDSIIVPKVLWYDFNDAKITDESVMNDTTGVYKAAEGSVFLDDELGDCLKIRDLPVENGSATEEFSFVPNDKLVDVIDTGTVTILTKKYLISFAVSNESITDVMISGAENTDIKGNCYANGDAILVVTVKTVDGVKYDATKVLAEAFGSAVTVIQNTAGFYSAKVTMPFKKVTFELA